MVKKTDVIITKLRRLKRKYNAERMILFGSRARWDFFEESDVDVLIISDKFRKKNMLQRMVDVQMNWDADQFLESFCYTPEEFEKNKNRIGIIQKALEEGIEL